MIKCKTCKTKFSYRNRVKALFDKDKKLKCKNCKEEYYQSLLHFKISFFIAAIVYIIFDSKVVSFLSKYIYSDFINNILIIILGAIWMLGFVYISQFCSRYKSYNDKGF